MTQEKWIVGNIMVINKRIDTQKQTHMRERYRLRFSLSVFVRPGVKGT